MGNEALNWDGYSQECFERKGSSVGVFHVYIMIREGHTVTDGSLKSEMHSLWGE